MHGPRWTLACGRNPAAEQDMKSALRALAAFDDAYVCWGQVRRLRPVTPFTTGVAVFLAALANAAPPSPESRKGERPYGVRCASPPPPTLSVIEQASSNRFEIVVTQQCSNATWRVERQKRGSISQIVTAGEGAVEAFEYKDSHLAPATDYCYRAVAVIGSSTATSPDVCKRTLRERPGAPRFYSSPLFSTVPELSTKLRFVLYDNSVNEVGFRIYRQPTPGQTAAFVATFPSADSMGTGREYEYVEGGLNPGDVRCFSAHAYHEEGSAKTEACGITHKDWNAPTPAFQWAVATGEPFKAMSLVNTTAGAGLGYSERVWGINLDWAAAAGPLHFERQPPSSIAPLLAGEPLAIYIDGGGFLVYETRNVGVELGWRTTPEPGIYQWRLIQRGSQAELGGIHALYNTHRNDYLVYGQRNLGINLLWYQAIAQAPGTSKTVTTTTALTAKPPLVGLIQYFGTIVGSGKLQKVEFPSHTLTAELTLLILKPGFTIDKCNDPKAAVPLAEKHTLTDAQMKDLFGTSRPTLPVKVEACLSSPRPAEAPLIIYLNVDYLTE